MSEAVGTLLECVVPTALVAELEAMPELEVKLSKTVDEPGLHFGLFEMAVVLLIVKRGLDIVKVSLQIYHLLKRLNQPEAKVLMRAPSGQPTIEITAADSEATVRQKVEKAYTAS